MDCVACIPVFMNYPSITYYISHKLFYWEIAFYTKYFVLSYPIYVVSTLACYVTIR